MTPVQKRLETLEKQVKALTIAMNNLTPNISTIRNFQSIKEIFSKVNYCPCLVKGAVAFAEVSI